MTATARRASSRRATNTTRGRPAFAPSSQPTRSARTIPPGSPQVPRWLAPAASSVSVLGLGMSTYLTITHYAASAVPLACPATGAINCEKVTTSPQSMIFGTPVAVYGAAFFVAMVAANLPPAWRSSRWWVGLGRLALAVAGIGFVVYLIYAELFLINAICLECTSVHVLTFILFVLVVTGTAHQGLTGWRTTKGDRARPGRPGGAALR